MPDPMPPGKRIGHGRLLRLYATLSQVNQAILRTSEPDTLFQRVCEIATTCGKFKFVWIGLVDPVSQKLLPAGQSGQGQEYLENIDISVDPENPKSRGPAGRAILTGKPQVIHSFLNNRNTQAWAQKARTHGFKSSMGVPISMGGTRIGVLMLYAGEERFFQRPEQKLVIEIAADISFALDYLQAQSLCRQAQETTTEHQRQLDLLLSACLSLHRLHQIKEIMREIVRVAIGVTGASKGLYGLPESNSVSEHEKFDGTGWTAIQGSSSRREGVVESIQTDRVPDTRKEPATDPDLKIQSHEETLQPDLIHVPILSSSREYLGFIELYEKTEGDPFTQKDQLILTSLSFHAAIALENAALLEELSVSESKLRLFKRSVDRSTASLCIADAMKPDYPLIYINDCFTKLTGYSSEEMLGKNCRLLQGGDRDQEVIGKIRTALENGQTGRFVLRNYRKDGSLFLNELSIFPVHDQDQTITHFLGIQNDITDTVALQKSQDFSAHVFDMASDGIMITDSSNRITHVNRAFTEITGYALADVRGQDPKILSSGHHDTFFFQTMWQELQSVGYWQGELWNRKKSGEVFPEWLSISSTRNEQCSIENYIGIFHDLTGIKASEERIAFLAYHDPLTGLPNRMLLRDRLEYAITQSRRSQRDLGILLLDLDGFKNVNDLLGHQMGDQLLVEASRRITQTVRTSDSVCRMGGDEFLLVFPNLADLSELSHIIDRLLRQLRRPFEFEGQQISITASGGVTLYPYDASEIDDLIRHADIAMYTAKNGGRNRVCYYETAMEGTLRKKEQLRNDLRKALTDGQLFLQYQPQVNLQNGDVFCAEALIRWQFSEGVIRMPNDFLPDIEDDDLSIEIGRWVLEEAVEQLERWKAKGIFIRIGVNVSPRHFVSGLLENDLKKIVAQREISLDSIELEITENTIIRDLPEAQRIVRDCRKYGLHFALDDFGTGFTSLITLKTLRPDTLKIDLSFLREMESEQSNRAILESILMIGKGFHANVVQEGVETMEDARLLRELGCTMVQGYLISRPVSPSQLEQFLIDWKTERSWTRY
ncbi:MAG: sensor domain-containing phosphodiesterase [Leptospirales bacterium]